MSEVLPFEPLESKETSSTQKPETSATTSAIEDMPIPAQEFHGETSTPASSDENFKDNSFRTRIREAFQNSGHYDQPKTPELDTSMVYIAIRQDDRTTYKAVTRQELNNNPPKLYSEVTQALYNKKMGIPDYDRDATRYDREATRYNREATRYNREASRKKS